MVIENHMNSIRPWHFWRPWVDFEGHFGELLTVVTLYAQLMCNLSAVAKFLVKVCIVLNTIWFVEKVRDSLAVKAVNLTVERGRMMVSWTHMTGVHLRKVRQWRQQHQLWRWHHPIHSCHHRSVPAASCQCPYLSTVNHWQLLTPRWR